MTSVGVIGVELAISVLGGLAFMVLYWSSPWGRTPAGRHMMAVSLVMAGESATLLALVVGVPVPPWVFVIGYGAGAVVVLHRLTLLYRARRAVAQKTPHPVDEQPR